MNTSPEILFYHVKLGTIEQVASLLLRKILDKKQMAVVHCSSQDYMESLSEFLWNVKDSFLPHITSIETDDLTHPIYLKYDDIIPLKRDILLSCGTAPKAEFINYERTVYIFHNDDTEQVQSARDFWKEYQSAYSLTYWIQNDEGRWQKGK